MVAWRYEIVVHKIFKIWNKINGIKWCRVLRVYIYRIENLKRYYVCEKIYLVNFQNVGWSGKMVSIKISNEYTELKYKGGEKLCYNGVGIFIELFLWNFKWEKAMCSHLKFDSFKENVPLTALILFPIICFATNAAILVFMYFYRVQCRIYLQKLLLSIRIIRLNYYIVYNKQYFT